MLVGDDNKRFSAYANPPHRSEYSALFRRDYFEVSMIDLLPGVTEIAGTARRNELSRQILRHCNLALALYTTERFETDLKKSHDRNVAVVVPTYDIREFVCETLESVRRQDHPRVAAIVVDDGSSDGTERAALHYLNSHSGSMSACLLQIPHFGWPSVTRNVALYSLLPVGSEFIAFMDGDDVFASPSAVSALIEALRANPAAFAAYGDYDWISEGGETLRQSQEIKSRRNGKWTWRRDRRLTWRNLALGNHGVHHFQTLAVRRGVPFIPYFYRGEDSGYFARLFKKSAETYGGTLGGVIQVPKLVCHYRVRGNSITNMSEEVLVRNVDLMESGVVKGWQLPGGAERRFEEAGIPDSFVTKETISVWLAKQWANETLRSMFRGKFRTGISTLRQSFRDRRVYRRHIIGQFVQYLGKQVLEPRVMIQIIRRAYGKGRIGKSPPAEVR
ncbi:hypothetical protein THIOKS11100010 [Thiocapsa sp. KS1]|nr:glycosyltransferase family A protein [Thiocapsa sp. KS1]CRI62997.1 hypothetical protein THIOKS11100010 [Thiocapsa sp. KS1]